MMLCIMSNMFNGMMHLIYKPHIKAVFVWVKYNDALVFAHKYIYFFHVKWVKKSNKNKSRKNPRKLPVDPKKDA